MANVFESYVQSPVNLPLVGEQEIIATVEHLDLPIEEYFVLGGANLVLRGIRRATTDLDVLVSDELFGSLQQVDGSEIKLPPKPAIRRGASNTTVWVKNNRTPIPLSATTSLGDGYYPMSFESHKDRVELVQGIPCIALDEVIAAKSALQREKDLLDLEDIGRYLGRVIPLSLNPVIRPLELS